ncbi:hypothetical protein IFM89_023242 [Coptis chinensis]|uniref:Uncharacterized protein n=1 Tax=Coptis chinensis TaxID=261450 RepID=A0A835HVS4_9MAGN|nr:hypothetical protein IFM89_023242 [Coptis chinensis]
MLERHLDMEKPALSLSYKVLAHSSTLSSGEMIGKANRRFIVASPSPQWVNGYIHQGTPQWVNGFIFWLARNGPATGDSHVKTSVVGTNGYATLEYVATGASADLGSGLPCSEAQHWKRGPFSLDDGCKYLSGYAKGGTSYFSRSCIFSSIFYHCHATSCAFPVLFGSLLDKYCQSLVKVVSLVMPPIAMFKVALLCGNAIARNASAVLMSDRQVVLVVCLLHASGFFFGYVLSRHSYYGYYLAPSRTRSLG